MKLPSKITIKITIIPVHALRCIEVQTPKWKNRSWSKFKYKKPYYRKGWKKGWYYIRMFRRGDLSEEETI